MLPGARPTGDPAAPKWRRIGNDAVDVPLAAPATGPVDAVWFSADGTRLYAGPARAAFFETADFENGRRLQPLLAPAPDDTGDRAADAGAERAAGIGVRAGFLRSASTFSVPMTAAVSWSNLTAYRRNPSSVRASTASRFRKSIPIRS